MAAIDLTTLADVKTWLQIAPGAFPSVDDALIARLITAASQYIVTWLGRPIARADYRENRDGTGGRRLGFAVTPVVTVLSLTVDDVSVPPATNATGSGYAFTPSELFLCGYRLARGIGNIVVTYTAGFAEVPPDIGQACLELVALRYRERTRIGEVSKRIGTDTVAYSQKDMSPSIATLLQQYRVVVPRAGSVPVLAPTDSDPALVAAAL